MKTRLSIIFLIFLLSFNGQAEVGCQQNLHALLTNTKKLNTELPQYVELTGHLKNKKGEIKKELIYQLDKLFLEQQKIRNINTTDLAQIDLFSNLITELKEEALQRVRLAGFTPLQVLAYRRGFEYSHILNRQEMSSVYRFTKDHTISQLLRDNYGNIPEVIGSKTRNYAPPGMLASYLSATRFGADINKMATPELNLTNFKFMENLDNALIKMKQIQGSEKKFLYRGSLWPEAWLNNLITSGVHRDFGYTSTSRELDMAKKFITNPTTVRHNGDNEKGIIFIYHTKKSVDISILSNFPEETEELIPRGTSFNSHFLGYRSEFCEGLVQVAPLENIAYVYLSDTHVDLDQAAMSLLKSDLCK